jgi:hypothetical protein
VVIVPCSEAVRRRRDQVGRFDEVEKAHSDVFNVLLQVLDDGQGRTVDFSNTLIILTSSLGEGQSVDNVEDQVMDVVRAHFRPEFLNRLDEIILFHRLADEHMGPIVDIQVGDVGKLLKDRKIKLELTGGARTWLGRVGYDPVYAARPLRRAVQKYLQDPLADKILKGEVLDGSTLKVDEGGWEAGIDRPVLTSVSSRRRRRRGIPCRHVRGGTVVALFVRSPLRIGHADLVFFKPRTGFVYHSASDIIWRFLVHDGAVFRQIGRYGRHGSELNEQYRRKPV